MAHPFRKMTTRQLRKLLQDDRERNRHLTEPPDRQNNPHQHIQPIRIQPIPPTTPRFQPSPVNHNISKTF
jgi:hypothetical protein